MLDINHNVRLQNWQQNKWNKWTKRYGVAAIQDKGLRFSEKSSKAKSFYKQFHLKDDWRHVKKKKKKSNPSKYQPWCYQNTGTSPTKNGSKVCLCAQAFSLPLEAAAVSISQRPVESISCSLVLLVSLYNLHCKLVSIIELGCFSALVWAHFSLPF